jgi:hypothetical protein
VSCSTAQMPSYVEASGDLRLTGVCCINMDEKVSDEKISAIFGTAVAFREEYED